MDKYFEWLDRHKGDVMEFVRMYLGFVLITKGAYFLSDINKLTELMGMTGALYTPLAIAHYIIFAHIVGGIFLVIGLLTRTVVLFQIPVLFGAVFLVHFHEAAFGANSSFEHALMVLVLLIAFAFYGSGRFSADYYLEKSSEKERLNTAHHH